MKLILLTTLLAVAQVATADSGALARARAEALQQIYGSNPDNCAMFFASGDPKAAAKGYSVGCRPPSPASQTMATQPKASQVQCVSQKDPDFKVTAIWSGDRLVLTRSSKYGTNVSSAVKDSSMGDYYKVVASSFNGKTEVPPLEHIHMYLSATTGKSTGTLTRLSAWFESRKEYLRKDEIRFSCDPPIGTNVIPVVAVAAPPPPAKGSSYDEFCAAKMDICKGHLDAVVKHGDGHPGADCVNPRGASLKTMYEAVNAWSIKNRQQTAALFVARPDSELRMNHFFFISEAMASLYACER